MKPLNNVFKDVALAEFPRISKNKRINGIHFRCRKSVIEMSQNENETLEYFNVDFLGDTGDIVYYWNTNVPDVYEKLCSQKRP